MVVQLVGWKACTKKTSTRAWQYGWPLLALRSTARMQQLAQLHATRLGCTDQCDVDGSFVSVREAVCWLPPWLIARWWPGVLCTGCMSGLPASPVDVSKAYRRCQCLTRHFAALVSCWEQLGCCKLPEIHTQALQSALNTRLQRSHLALGLGGAVCLCEVQRCQLGEECLKFATEKSPHLTLLLAFNHRLSNCTYNLAINGSSHRAVSTVHCTVTCA
jgi:hypothetical protein